MKKINVALLFGGRSGEHEVSLNSAQAIANALDKEKYNIIAIAIAKNGQWYAPIDLDKISTFKPQNFNGYEVTLPPYPNSSLTKLSNYEPLDSLNVVFPIIHGTYGEDGKLQGLLEMANIPYVGSGVLGSAVGMDKIIMKTILAQHNLPQVKFVSVLRTEIEKNLKLVTEHILNKIDFPLFIKPANLGSSVGISKAKNIYDLQNALILASKYDRKIIVEEGVDVREIEISVLGNNEPLVSVPGEVIPCNEFYDYKAKYIDDKSELVIPADLETQTLAKLQQLAKNTFLALNCSGLARIDFFICKNTNNIYINEINTLPGFTAISMYPKLWEYSGISMPELLDKLISLAFSRFQEHNRNVTDFTL